LSSCSANETAETALKAVSAMVVASALLGMVTMILTTLNERRREMAVLRSVGARPRTVLGLLMAEAGVLTLAGIALGVVLLYAALLVLQPYVDRSYGLHLPIELPKPAELGTLATIGIAGCLACRWRTGWPSEREECLQHGRWSARDHPTVGPGGVRWRV
jgi:putative ABC transport system permease protein